MTAEAFSILTSSMLAWMTGLAMTVGLYQLVKKHEWQLAIFCLFMFGILARELIVKIAGPGYWEPHIFWMSSAAKWVQIYGLGLFAWDCTNKRCSHWMWILFVIISALLTMATK